MPKLTHTPRGATAGLLALACGASPLLAQGRTPASPAPRPEALPSRVDYVPRERYEQIRALVVGTRSQGGTLFNAPDEQTSYLLVHRTAPSEPEEHSRWDDVIIVRAGSGTIELGRRTTGARMAAPGEFRGGTIAAPSRLVLRPGDIARIPAGVPHAFSPSGREPWELLIVKVRRPNRPLRRVASAAP
jgi:mannose-6-phosphate isomerase-like protein (cupin superfamily)